MMDYIQPLYEFKDKRFDIHLKDVKILPNHLNGMCILAYPQDFMSPKLSGDVDIDLGSFVSALTDIGYNSFAFVEVENHSIEGGFGNVLDSLKISSRYLSQFVI